MIKKTRNAASLGLGLALIFGPGQLAHAASGVPASPSNLLVPASVASGSALKNQTGDNGQGSGYDKGKGTDFDNDNDKDRGQNEWKPDQLPEFPWAAVAPVVMLGGFGLFVLQKRRTS